MALILSNEEADILYYSRKQIILDHGWENRDNSSSYYAHLEVVCEDGMITEVTHVQFQTK